MNKKVLFGVLAALATTQSFAQLPEDALRFSRPQASGTARVQALGGASGALGGEISTIFSNPANIGFYRTGDLVISPYLNLNSNKNTYFGNTVKNSAVNNFNLGTSGVVFGTEHYGRKTTSSALGIAINRTADFNNDLTYRGKNNYTSMADAFIDEFEENSNPNQFTNDLADRTYWIRKVNGSWVSPAIDLLENGVGLNQEQRIRTRGGITEFALAGGWNFENKVYFGATVGVPVVKYERDRYYTESDPSGNNNNNFDHASYNDHLNVTGAGFNLKLGLLFAPSQNFRFGFALHTPTFYSLNDEYYSSASTNTENFASAVPNGDNKTTHSAASHDADATNYFGNNGISEAEYRLQTPLKVMGSFTYLLGNPNNVSTQRGLITGDVEFVNHKSSRFRTPYDDDYDKRYYDDLNDVIKDIYKPTVNGRLGMELKFNTLAVRVGGAYYGNPYKNIAGEKGSTVQATGGLGYRNRGFFVDLGYVHALNKDVVFPYRTTADRFEPANIKNTNGRITLTFGIKI